MARCVGQKFAAKFERILSAGGGEFVDKTFGDESVLRISDRAPEPNGNAGFRQRVFDKKIGDAIFAVGLAFHGTFIDAVFHRAGKKARHDRWADDAALQSDGPAVRIEPRRQFAVNRGAVKIVLNVVFARPGHLHGRAGGFRNLDRVHNEILLRAPPESPAKKRGVDSNLLRFEAGDFRRSHLIEGLKLRRRVNIAAIGAHVRGAIHGLHGGVREKGNFVGSFDFFRGAGEGGVGVAILAGDSAGLFGGVEIELSNGVAGIRGVCTLVPA